MSTTAANDVPSVEQRVEDALTSGSERARTVAFRDWIEASLLLRQGEVLTPEIARERANNMSSGLMEFLYGRLT